MKILKLLEFIRNNGIFYQPEQRKGRIIGGPAGKIKKEQVILFYFYVLIPQLWTSLKTCFDI